MIEVERMNGQKIMVNSDLIKIIESNPDTTITFTDGEKILLRTSVNEIIHKIIEYKKKYSVVPEVRQ